MITNIGQNTADGTLVGCYFVQIAHYEGTPYYLNYRYGNTLIMMTVADTEDAMLDILAGLNYTAIIWYIDYCTMEERPVCRLCGSTCNVQYREDPYDADVLNQSNMYDMCLDCYNIRADDV